MDKQKKLYRSQTNKMLTGVSGGLADYLEVDATIIRIVFVLMFFASGGFALLIYIILAIIVPLEPPSSEKGTGVQSNKKTGTKTFHKSRSGAGEQLVSDTHVRWIIAAILILIGFNALTRAYFPWLHLQWGVIWPVVLIVIGLYLILRTPNTPSIVPKEKNADLKQESKTRKKKEVNSGRLLSGFILVVLGVLFLAHVLGLATVQVGAIWSLWPLLLIYIGVALVSPWRWATLLLGAVITLIVAWALLTGAFAGSRSMEKQIINIDKVDGIEAASVNIKMGAGRLNVGGGADQLIEGALDSNILELKINSEAGDNVQRTDLRGVGSWKWLRGGRGANEMNIRLNNDIPTDISVSTGAMDMKLDLIEVITTSIDIDTGASNLVLDLGDKAESNDVKINAGASSIRISLPADVGARIRVDSGLSSVNLQEFNRVESKIYVSENYDDADRIVNMEINMGVSNLDVVWR